MKLAKIAAAGSVAALCALTLERICRIADNGSFQGD